MSNLLIRWTFGEWIEKRTDPQGISLLRTSIEFAKLIFPEAEFALCCNHLYWSRDEIEELVATTGIPLIDALPHLPEELRSQRKNAWWKYAPPRLNPDGFELVLDNDVILWRRPPELETWLEEGGVLGLGERAKSPPYLRFYGDYVHELAALDPCLDFNSGILGWPPGFTPSLVGAKHNNEFVLTEQGFSALLFSQYTGPQHLIPFKAVPLMHHCALPPQALLNLAYGAHFCQCTYGLFDHWKKRYQAPVEAYLAQYQQAPASA